MGNEDRKLIALHYLAVSTFNHRSLCYSCCAMPWTVSDATLADVPAITSIFSHDEPTPFLKLCLGSSNVLALNFKQSDHIIQCLQDSAEKWIVARDEHNKIASFAQWQLPEETQEQVVEEPVPIRKVQLR